MIELCATHFAAKKPKAIAIANRTLERGEKLATRFGEVMRLADLPERLHEFDAVISCTASSLPIIGLGAVERASKRRHRPSSWWTWPCRATSSPKVKAPGDVYLYTVDDLATVVQTAQANRQAAVAQAEAIIDAGVQASCTGWTSATRQSPLGGVVPLIQQLNAQTDEWRAIEIAAPKSCWPRARTSTPCSKPCRAASRKRCCTAPWPSCARATPKCAPRRRRPFRACSCARPNKPVARSPAPRRSISSQIGLQRIIHSATNTVLVANPSQIPMKPFLRSQLERYAQRLHELDFLLSREDIMSDMAQYRRISVEHAEVTQIAGALRPLPAAQGRPGRAARMLADP